MTRYERGYRDAIKDAAEYLRTANISPAEAKGHIGNAGGMLEYALERGWLKPSKPEPK